MSRKIKSTIYLILMLGVFVFSAMAVSAAALGQIDVTVKDDASTPNVISGLSTKLYDPSGYDTGITPDVSTPGLYEFQNLTTAGAYTVLFYTGDATTGAEVNVNVALSSVTAITAKDTKANLTWVSSATKNPAKSGVIGGTATDGTSVLSGVTVEAYNKKATYIMKSDSNGAYKLYVPADKYTLVIVGKEASPSDDLYKNLSYPITVLKGQMVGLMDDVNAQTSWNGENANGLIVSGFDGNDKAIKGFALANATVSAYVYTGSDTTGNYRFLKSAVVGTNTKAVRSALGALGIVSTTQGAFSIKLDTYYPNQKIAVRVKDAALNVYEDGTYIVTPVASDSMNLLPDITNATISQPIDITFADSTGLSAMTSYLKSKIASVSATYGGTTITLTPTTQYKIGTNKVTILAGVLSTPQDYKITISATGYNDGNVLQTIGASTTVAPTLSGTYAIKTGGGTVWGSTQFSAIGTKAAGDSLVYVVSSQSAAQVKLGNTVTGYTTLVANTDITGVNMTDPSKYIYVYEISPTDAVVKAKLFTLAATQIKGPLFTTGDTASAATIVLNTDATLSASSVPAAKQFVVMKGSTVKTVSGVAISGSQVTLLLTDTNTNQILNGDTITVGYTRPTSGYLKDINGNAMATISSVGTITNVTPAAKTPSSAATSSATEVIITMSGSLSGSTADTGAFAVKKGSTTFTTTGATVSGNQVIIDIDGPITSGDTITVSYTATGTNDLTDGTVKVANFANYSVTTN